MKLFKKINILRRCNFIYFTHALPLFILLAEQRSLSGYIGGDFRIFHQAVQRFVANPANLYGQQGQALWAAQSLQGYIYPPPSILALLPFGMGSLESDFTLFVMTSILAGIIALALCLLMLRKSGGALVPGKHLLFILLLALVSGPVFACRAGQIDLAILLLCVLGIWCGLGKMPAWAGSVLAVGTWIKIYPLLLLVPIFWGSRKRFRLVIGFACTGTAIPLITATFIPQSVWHDYFVDLLPHMTSRTIINIYNQSLSAIFLRTSIPHTQALNSFDALPVPALVRIFILGLGASVLFASSWLGRNGDRQRLLACLVALACISLIAPLGWGHTYVYALPLWMSVAWGAIEKKDWKTIFVALTTWLLLLVSAHHQFAFADRYSLFWHLAYSRYAIAVILLLTWAVRSFICNTKAL